jgi:hypothetical protein
VASGVLNYTVTVSGIRPADLILVALHRGDANQLGPAIAPLVRTGSLSAKGQIALRQSERDDLLAGRLYVRWSTRSMPLGHGTVPVVVGGER